MQLVTDKIGMVDTMKNKIIGKPEVFEKFGVGPEKVVEVQSLAGDSVDNVPGVPGIGLKTAALLINEFGDLDTLLEQAETIKQKKRRENLIEFAEQARISKRLVQLEEAVPVETPVEDFSVCDVDGAQAVSFLKAMGFTSLTKKVADKTGAVLENIEAADVVIEGWESTAKPAEQAEDSAGELEGKAWTPPLWQRKLQLKYLHFL